MRNKHINKIISIFFLFALISFTFLTVWSASFKLAEKQTQNTNENKFIELYPFDEEIKITEQVHKLQAGKISKLKKIYSYIKEKFEAYTSDKLRPYHTLVEAAKKYEDVIGWNIDNVSGYNTTVTIGKEYLVSYTVSKDVSKSAIPTIEFADYCKNNSIDFIYMNYPSKICRYDDNDISGILDFSNQNADRFLAMLKEAGVKIYDLREALHKDKMNHHEAFYKTDHHWKTQTGLWAAKQILQFIRDNYGWNINPEILNPENFDYVTYPEWFLGSEGRRHTLTRAKPEDFTMIYPKYKTLFHYEVLDIDLNTSGDFSVTYDMQQLMNKDYYQSNPYGAYNYGDKALRKINNIMNNGSKKILFIHDSFSNSMIPFLALGINYIEALDLRHFKGSLKSYIKQNKPDMIITAYCSTFPGSVDDWYIQLYDFR